MTIVASYVIAVLFLTPMALLLSEVGAPGALTDSLLGWRLVDTLLGCVVAILAGRLLWPSRARLQLDASLDRALGGIDAVLAAAETTRTGDPLIGSTTAKWMLARTAPDDDELRARRMAVGRGRRGRAAASRARRRASAAAGAAAGGVGSSRRGRATGGAGARGDAGVHGLGSPQGRSASDDPSPGGRSPAQRALRHDLRVRLLNLRSVTDAALGDRFTSAPREDDLWPITAAVQQVGFRALALDDGDTDELRREVTRLRRQLADR